MEAAEHSSSRALETKSTSDTLTLPQETTGGNKGRKKPTFKRSSAMVVDEDPELKATVDKIMADKE